MEVDQSLTENMENDSQEETKAKRKRLLKRKIRDTWPVIYIKTIVMIMLGQIAGGILINLITWIFPALAGSDVWITGGAYLMFIGIWICVLLIVGISKRERAILRVIWTGPEGNTLAKLLAGFVIGFGMNGICLLAAWLNRDIVLYFDRFELLSLLFVFATVFVQSSAEELVCRGYLYQRFLKSYGKPASAIVGNSLLFAILHLTNDGITALSVLNIFLVGIVCSLAVYYMDSLWCAAAIHTAWNFMQNIIFGLPNSGMTVPYSVFKLDAGAAVNSFAYNVGFGLEGTVMADIVILTAGILLFLWGRKHGKKHYNVWER